MIVVTGGAGFIGSNIVRGLNARGIDEVVVVDDLTDGRKFVNLVDARIADYLDKDEFLTRLEAGALGELNAIFHEGACTVTTEWNGRLMMDANYRYSVRLLDYCLACSVPLIYASSAAVYGASQRFIESEPALERPLNVYGYSKLLFDQRVRRVLPAAASQLVGLRYFNVYGPGEAYKGQMASVALHLHEQFLDTGEVRLFDASHGYGPGEQRRDFVYVEDIARLNLWFLDHPEQSGIFNAGTGASATFNDVANAVLEWHREGAVRYVPFPDGLRERYQSFTEADLTALRGAGYDASFTGVREGVRQYLDRIGARRP